MARSMWKRDPCQGRSRVRSSRAVGSADPGPAKSPTCADRRIGRSGRECRPFATSRHWSAAPRGDLSARGIASGVVDRRAPWRYRGGHPRWPIHCRDRLRGASRGHAGRRGTGAVGPGELAPSGKADGDRQRGWPASGRASRSRYSRRALLLRPGRVPEALARGQGGYVPKGGEPYIALSLDRRVPGAGCAFVRDDIYALDASSSPGVVRIDRRGRAGRFAELPSGAFPSGIAFDNGGAFGYRLLVTTVVGETTTLYAIDCRGRMTLLTRAGRGSREGSRWHPRPLGSSPETCSRRTRTAVGFSPSGRKAVCFRGRLPPPGRCGHRRRRDRLRPPRAWPRRGCLLRGSRRASSPTTLEVRSTSTLAALLRSDLARRAARQPATSSWRKRARSRRLCRPLHHLARSPPGPRPPPTAKATSIRARSRLGIASRDRAGRTARAEWRIL